MFLKKSCLGVTKSYTRHYRQQNQSNRSYLRQLLTAVTRDNQPKLTTKLPISKQFMPKKAPKRTPAWLVEALPKFLKTQREVSTKSTFKEITHCLRDESWWSEFVTYTDEKSGKSDKKKAAAKAVTRDNSKAVINSLTKYKQYLTHISETQADRTKINAFIDKWQTELEPLILDLQHSANTIVNTSNEYNSLDDNTNVASTAADHAAGTAAAAAARDEKSQAPHAAANEAAAAARAQMPPPLEMDQKSTISSVTTAAPEFIGLPKMKYSGAAQAAAPQVVAAAAETATATVSAGSNVPVTAMPPPGGLDSTAVVANVAE